MSDLYNLIFFPTVKPGEDEAEVKSSLAARLKVDAAKVDSWFASGRPTLLLKEVAPDVADRYMQAILDCGGSCNMQPSGSDGKGSLSLIPKPANVELFICPQCEFEEELGEGESYEQCPSCGLVLAKWAEKQEEDRKKEEIRRRLLRDARFRDEGASEEERRKAELAELKRLEAEIMKELGIKPPSKLWQIFSQRPFSISLSIGILLVAASSLVSFYVSEYISTQEAAEIAAAPPSPEIQQLAPAMAGVIGMQISGNKEMVDELASATQLLTGQGVDSEALTSAAEQMMKGAGNETFLEQANSSQTLKSSTPGGLGEPAPVAVNRDTLGGVVGLPGPSDLTAEQLAQTNPGEIDHGYENVSMALTRKLQLPDPDNPNGADILVDQIDRLDGSKLVALLKSLSRDLEWDHFLASQVRAFLKDDRFSQANELADLIQNPLIKAGALVDAIAHLARRNPNADLKLPLARLSVALGDIDNIDLRAKHYLRLARLLSLANVPDQPYGIFNRVEELADSASSPEDQAVVLARLAAAQVEQGDNQEAKALFTRAMRAGARAGVVKRIYAFSKIASRYYDARNLTLAGEILAEAQVLAATELLMAERATAFVFIATAQLHQGDMTGALNSVNNAATGAAKHKLLAQLASWLVDRGEIYKAQALMAELMGTGLEDRLAIRLIGRVANLPDARKARALLSEYSPSLGGSGASAEQALLLSQFARLHLRLRQPDQADQLFEDALQIADQIDGRKSGVARGMVALDQARGLWLGRAKDTMERVTETIVAEPIGSEILATERTVKNLLPKDMRDRAVAAW